MEKDYWLHRISHESEASYNLLKKGWLTLGWSAFALGSGILDISRKEDKNHTEFENKYAEIVKEKKYRSRWDMWYFARFRKGDTIVVPLSGGTFAICEALDQAYPIPELINEEKDGFEEFEWDEGHEEGKRLHNKITGKYYDLGFAIKVDVKAGDIPRTGYAEPALTSRMKMRQTNGRITGLEKDVEAALKRYTEKNPINFLADVYENTVENLLKVIDKKLNYAQFESLIKNYMERIGADKVYIPPKNEHGKKEVADADVVALFTPLLLKVIIQAKKHEGQTDEQAVKQIITYREQILKEDTFHENENEYTNCIAWAVTTAEFNENAKELAMENDVRLIEGDEFVRMLLSAGLTGLDV